MADQIIADRYEVLSKLGSGGAAIVYKVKDLSLKNICALKTLRYEEPKSDHLIRFQREARSISGLKHPNIVSTLDFGMDSSNRPFLVMEFIDGISLKQFIKRNGPLPQKIALSVIEQIADALSYVHSNGILHRDIKSENIMVVGASKTRAYDFEGGSELKVMLLDFGLAIDFEDSLGKGLTKAGVAMGTPMYMSPEQCQGKPVNERSEIYSVGCLLYELLTGRPPLKGGTALETITMQQEQFAPSLNESNCGIEFEQELESLVAKSLEKDPSKRFASMDELKLEIQILLGKNIDFLENQDNIDTQENLFRLEPETVSKQKIQPLYIAIALVAVLGSVALGYRLFGTTTEPTLKKKASDDLFFETFKPDTSKTFYKMGADSGIKFHIFSTAPNTTNKEVTSVKPDAFPKILSLCSQVKVTDIGLSYVSKIPLQGIGLNGRDLTGDQLRMFAKPDSKLEVIWMKNNPKIKDSDLEALTNLKCLKYISLAENSISDKALEYIAQIPSLVTLKIEQLRNFKGTGLKHLIDCNNLKKLCLSKNRLSPEGWQNLSKLKQLRLLNLSNTNISIHNIGYIKDLNIEKLDLSKNHLNDEALTTLYSMKSLKLLYLYKSWKVTPDGEAVLRKKLPNCQIVTDRIIESEDIDPLLLTETFN